MSVSQTSNQPAMLTVNPVVKTPSAGVVNSTNEVFANNTAGENKNGSSNHNFVNNTVRRTTNEVENKTQQNKQANSNDQRNSQTHTVSLSGDRIFKDFLVDNEIHQESTKPLKNSDFLENELSSMEESVSVAVGYADNKVDNDKESVSGFAFSSVFFERPLKDNQIAATIKNISEKIKSLTSIVQNREVLASDVTGLESNQSEKGLTNNLNYDTNFVTDNVDGTLEIKPVDTALTTKETAVITSTVELDNGNQSGKVLPPEVPSLAVSDAAKPNPESSPVSQTASLETSTVVLENNQNEQKGQSVEHIINNKTVAEDSTASQIRDAGTAKVTDASVFAKQYATDTASSHPETEIPKDTIKDVFSSEQVPVPAGTEKPVQTDSDLKSTTLNTLTGHEAAARQTENVLKYPENTVTDDKANQLKNNFLNNRELTHPHLVENNGRDNDSRLYDAKESTPKLPDISSDKLLASNKESPSQTQPTSTPVATEQAIKHSGSHVLQQDIQRAVVQRNPLASPLPNMLAHSQWQNGVGDKVLWMAAQNIQSAEVQLDPPELGQLHIKISIGQESASVNFISPHASVREALDAGAFRLREMFQQEGLDLVDVGVSDQSKQQSFTENDGDSRSGSQDNGGHGVSGSDNQLASNETIMNQKIGLNNMVDFYA